MLIVYWVGFFIFTVVAVVCYGVSWMDYNDTNWKYEDKRIVRWRKQWAALPLGTLAVIVWPLLFAAIVPGLFLYGIWQGVKLLIPSKTDQAGTEV